MPNFQIENESTWHACTQYVVFLELALPREIDPENPIMRHPDDCKVYYIFNFPMTCGEGTAFSEELKACVTEEEAGC